MNLFVLTIIGFVGFVVSPNPHGGLTIPEVIEKLWLQADTNHDNHLSLPEFLAEFLTSFDHDYSGVVSNHEFVHQWQHNYHEHHQVVVHIFQHFDMDKDGVISSNDLTNLFHRLDNNVDNLMEHAEFGALMAFVYGTLPLPVA